MSGDDKVIVFGEKNIRRVWDEESGEWFFSVVDVVGVLTDSSIPRRYWTDLKSKLAEEGFQLYDKIVQLKMKASDGKKYMTDCATQKGIFRIIQSIPSKKAEPFKLWLAKVGSERIDEVVDPEISIDRAMKNYLRQGRSREWINQRIKTLEVRKELTDEWGRVGIREGMEFAVLTDEITKGWSDFSVKDYKRLKNLKKENLRDNMTNLELVLNMLAEVTTKEFSRAENPEGLGESLDVARRGGSVVGNTRREIESVMGESVVSDENYLERKEKERKEKKKRRVICA